MARCSGESGGNFVLRPEPSRNAAGWASGVALALSAAIMALRLPWPPAIYLLWLVWHLRAGAEPGLRHLLIIDSAGRVSLPEQGLFLLQLSRAPRANAFVAELRLAGVGSAVRVWRDQMAPPRWVRFCRHLGIRR